MPQIEHWTVSLGVVLVVVVFVVNVGDGGGIVLADAGLVEGIGVDVTFINIVSERQR
jgi:hypothetical protein